MSKCCIYIPFIAYSPCLPSIASHFTVTVLWLCARCRAFLQEFCPSVTQRFLPGRAAVIHMSHTLNVKARRQAAQRSQHRNKVEPCILSDRPPSFGRLYNMKHLDGPLKWSSSDEREICAVQQLICFITVLHRVRSVLCIILLMSASMVDRQRSRSVYFFTESLHKEKWKDCSRGELNKHCYGLWVDSNSLCWDKTEQFWLC